LKDYYKMGHSVRLISSFNWILIAT